MGFNKRYINLKSTIDALDNGKLKEYYGKADMFIFDDTESAEVYHLFSEGKTDKELLNFIKTKLNEKNSEKNRLLV